MGRRRRKGHCLLHLGPSLTLTLVISLLPGVTHLVKGLLLGRVLLLLPSLDVVKVIELV